MTFPQHWTAEQNHNYRTEDGSPAWVLRYDPTPNGKKNDNGSTSYSVNFPAMQFTDWVSEPEKAANKIALALNSHDDVVAALRGLLKANDDVQTVLCDGPDVPGLDLGALGAAQSRVTEAEAIARAALGKAEPVAA